MNQFVTVLALVCVSAAAGLALDSDPTHLKLEVFYESLCPDSKRFMKNQLAPAYAALSDYFDVDAIAFGFSSFTPTKNGGYNFTCQHGPEECEGNKMFACARQYIGKHEAYINFTICAMSTQDPPGAFDACSHLLTQGEMTIIKECKSSMLAEVLLEQLGKLEHATSPGLNYIPWMIVDGKSSPTLQDEAEHHLITLICSKLSGTKPVICGAV